LGFYRFGVVFSRRFGVWGLGFGFGYSRRFGVWGLGFGFGYSRRFGVWGFIGLGLAIAAVLGLGFG